MKLLIQNGRVLDPVSKTVTLTDLLAVKIKYMAKMLVLRWTPITTNSGIWFDSNLVILTGTSGVHIEMTGKIGRAHV